MTRNFKLFLCWFVSGTIACFIALGWTSGSYIDGVFLPMGHDSFYHARRIISAVENLSNFYQFDPTIHAPEGSWITWPWFYDWAIAVFTQLILKLNHNVTPMFVITHIPPMWVYLNTALIIGIATCLRLSITSILLAGLIYAFSPLTLFLHGVGAIDHHFMEQTCILSLLLTGLLWFRDTEKKRYALAFGAILGFSHGIHNGLFILAIPIIATYVLLWKNKDLPSAKSTYTFVVTYLASLLLMLIPSEPFLNGLFEYYTLSWFHLYIALCVASVLMFLNYFDFSIKNVAKLFVLCIILFLPILTQVKIGLSFIGGDLYSIKAMTESISLWGMLSDEGWSTYRITQFYSFLIWFMPIIMIVIIINLYKIKTGSGDLIYFYIYSLFGYLMLVQQYRFNHFGSFAIYLPLIMMIEKSWLNHHSLHFKQALILVLSVLAIYPGISLDLYKPPLALNKDHHLFRPMYIALGELCDKAPGVVLANMNDGHYISYYTKCSVIADNFIQTQQHIDKIKLTEELMATPVDDAIKNYPWIDYYFVRVRKFDIDNKTFPPNDIRNELLNHNFKGSDKLKLLVESNIRVDVGSNSFVLARIYQITR